MGGVVQSVVQSDDGRGNGAAVADLQPLAPGPGADRLDALGRLRSIVLSPVGDGVACGPDLTTYSSSGSAPAAIAVRPIEPAIMWNLSRACTSGSSPRSVTSGAGHRSALGSAESRAPDAGEDARASAAGAPIGWVIGAREPQTPASRGAHPPPGEAPPAPPDPGGTSSHSLQRTKARQGSPVTPVL